LKISLESKSEFKFNYRDWFIDKSPSWTKILKNLKGIDYLEIGTFEGRSAVSIGQLGITNSITCVDTFEGSPEHNDINFEIVYKNCKENLYKINCKTNLYKKDSNSFFIENKKKFDVIYIDGSHYYEDVKNDLNQSLAILKKNGILICDDFLWFFYKDLKANPIYAILEFYYSNQDHLKILFINNQVFFKKII